jgi:hypothetical protein
MGGTDVIDYLQTFTCKIGAPFCRVLNDQFPFLATFVPSIIVPIFSEALAGVSDEARGNFENEFFYVRTQMEDSDVTSPLYATHLYLSFHQGEPQNDGLIPTAHEMLWENTSGNSRLLGTDLGVMIGDHNSLLNKAMLPSTDLYRQAFFRALVERMLFGAVQ